MRGRDIERYGYTFVNTYLINTHNGYRSLDNIEVPPVNIKNFPAIESHLNAYWEDLKFRRDKGITPYNLRNCAYMDDFSKQKIVWSRLMRISKDQNENFPRFALIEKDYFVQDSLCFITGGQLDYLCAILNSNLGAFYYFINMAVLDNGGIQMRQHYVELFPIPNLDTIMGEKFRSLLGAQVDPNEPSFRSKMDQVVYDLYCFSEEEISHIDQYVKDQLESINDR